MYTLSQEMPLLTPQEPNYKYPLSTIKYTPKGNLKITIKAI